MFSLSRGMGREEPLNFSDKPQEMAVSGILCEQTLYYSACVLSATASCSAACS